MIPYDGMGFGSSNYWSYRATDLVKESSEDCTHGEKKASVYSDTTKQFYFNFHVTCPNCETKFPESEEKLTQEYLKFYGMKV